MKYNPASVLKGTYNLLFLAHDQRVLASLSEILLFIKVVNLLENCMYPLTPYNNSLRVASFL
jgi:hypothetical protein